MSSTVLSASGFRACSPRDIVKQAHRELKVRTSGPGTVSVLCEGRVSHASCRPCLQPCVLLRTYTNTEAAYEAMCSHLSRSSTVPLRHVP